jgi:transposase-like protein
MKRDAGKETFWRQALEECQSSGQSVRDFCRQRDLKESLFYAWRRELGRRDVGVSEKAGFVELVRPAGVKEEAGVSIRVDERVRVVLERGFDRETLQATVACLCAVPVRQHGGRASADARAQTDGVRAP